MARTSTPLLGKTPGSAKIHGHIPGVEPGHRFESRVDCAVAHPPLERGIYGSATVAAFSIVMSGGYEDDVDNGDEIIYSGEGGRVPVNQVNGRKSSRTTKQGADQEFTKGNKSLQLSYIQKKPLRVIRGEKLNSVYAPASGYVYDGLYNVVSATRELGSQGYMMCMFRLVRQEGQPRLPERSNFNFLAARVIKQRRTQAVRMVAPLTIDTSRIKRVSPDPYSKASGSTLPRYPGEAGPSREILRHKTNPNEDTSSIASSSSYCSSTDQPAEVHRHKDIKGRSFLGPGTANPVQSPPTFQSNRPSQIIPSVNSKLLPQKSAVSGPSQSRSPSKPSLSAQSGLIPTDVPRQSSSATPSSFSPSTNHLKVLGIIPKSLAIPLSQMKLKIPKRRIKKSQPNKMLHEYRFS